jgi:SAM-dependent methyltransferase
MVAPQKPSDDPNAEQVKYWNEVAGPLWVAREELLDAAIAPAGRRAMDAAAPAAGELVLDVGCGCGSTTLELARRVGPTGQVLGVDLSEPMLARARVRAEESGVANARFMRADAQTADLGRERFDVLYSRFGVMFFADPPAAFANLRRSLKRGGRVAFVCWQPVQRNPWMLLPALAVGRHLPLPAPDPAAPGPFAFADPARVQDVLARGGFSDVAIDGAEFSLAVGGGGDLDRATEFTLEVGPAASALRAANAGPELRRAVVESVREALAPYERDGGVWMDAAVWLVSARA